MNVKKFSKGKPSRVSPDQSIYVVSNWKLAQPFKVLLTTFQSAFNKNTFLIRHSDNWKSSCIIYLMECCLCEKYEYVGKPEYRLNPRINKHWNYIWRTMIYRATIILKCQVIISMLTLSLLSLTRFIISHCQSWKSAAC